MFSLRSVSVLLPLLLSFIPFGIAGSQVIPGSRVRVWVAQDSAAGPRVGMLMRQAGDSVFLLQKGQDSSLVLTGITRLQVAAKGQSHTGRGMLIGAGVGALFGLGMSSLAGESVEGDTGAEIACYLLLGICNQGVATVSGALLGMGIGALAGKAGTQWQDVELRAPLIAGSGGIGLSIQMPITLPRLDHR